MNDKEIQVSTEELVITQQPKSYGTINKEEQAPLLPINAKSSIEINCDNCKCCTFSC